jgi:phosphoribosylamine--glycine ligase
VVIAAKGYPENPITGGRIEGLEIVLGPSTAIVFHAGTRREGRKYYVSGGRVLGISSIGEDVGTARSIVYDTVSTVRFDGMQFRQDIGTTGVQQASSASNSIRS